MDNQRNEPAHEGNVNGREMRIVQLREVAKSVDKPKVSIGSCECSLCGLQREDEID